MSVRLVKKSDLQIDCAHTTDDVAAIVRKDTATIPTTRAFFLHAVARLLAPRAVTFIG